MFIVILQLKVFLHHSWGIIKGQKWSLVDVTSCNPVKNKKLQQDILLKYLNNITTLIKLCDIQLTFLPLKSRFELLVYVHFKTSMLRTLNWGTFGPTRVALTWQSSHGCSPGLSVRRAPHQENRKARCDSKRGKDDTDVCSSNTHYHDKNKPKRQWVPARQQVARMWGAVSKPHPVSLHSGHTERNRLTCWVTITAARAGWTWNMMRRFYWTVLFVFFSLMNSTLSDINQRDPAAVLPSITREHSALYRSRGRTKWSVLFVYNLTLN